MLVRTSMCYRPRPDDHVHWADAYAQCAGIEKSLAMDAVYAKRGMRSTTSVDIAALECFEICSRGLVHAISISV